MKKILGLCLSLMCLSIFCFTSCQNPAGTNPEGTDNNAESILQDAPRLIWKGELEKAPENPEKNWVYYNTAEYTTYIWNVDSKKWDILAKAKDIEIPEQQTPETSGSIQTVQTPVLFNWKGSLATPPANPETNWAYYNTTEGKIYIYANKEWSVFFQLPKTEESSQVGNNSENNNENNNENNLLTCENTERGLKIGVNTYLVPDVQSLYYTKNGSNAITNVELIKKDIVFTITDNKTGITFHKNIQVSYDEIWLSPFYYPLTKKGEPYDITVEMRNTTAFRSIATFKGVAKGGIGCPVLANADTLKVEYDSTTKIISFNEAPNYDLSNCDGEIIDKEISYALYADEPYQSWQYEGILKYSEKGNAYTSFNMHTDSGWKPFNELNVRLMGNKLFASTTLLLRLSGCDAENTYISFPFKSFSIFTDYEPGSKKNKVIIFYNAYDIDSNETIDATNAQNFPWKIYSYANPSDPTEVLTWYGDIVDYDSEYFEPIKIPTIPGYKFIRWDTINNSGYYYPMNFNGPVNIKPDLEDKLTDSDISKVTAILGDSLTDYNDLYFYDIIAMFEQE